ncbi:MAG: TonB-dependent receptor [Proteobacteria bacterium]|nr:TonB-dependent receptor [Pseudomonadota bacterium]
MTYRHTKAVLALAGGVAVAALLAADPAFAQAAADGASKSENEIVVLGTRRQDRTVTTSASPIDVISAGELQSQPTANMIDSLNNIIPSFFVGQNTISDASSFVRSPSLRGQPGDATLVMLNGKRFNRSALVQVYTGGDTGLSFGSQGSDIAAIPSIAIKNLEVLRDGATAQYGSDAIAGVLNYGLRDNAKGFEVQVRHGQYYDHGDGKSEQIAANLGLSLGGNGFINLSGEYNDDGQTSRGGYRPLAIYLTQANPTAGAAIPGASEGLPPQIWGSSPSHGWKAVVNSGYNVTPNSKIYLFGLFAHNKANESFNYRSPVAVAQTFATVDGRNIALNGNGAFRNPFYQTLCPTGNATCPAGGYVQDTNTFSYSTLYPGGFTPRFVGITDEAYGVLGWKGKADNGFTWDLAGSLSKNQLALSMYNSLSPTFGAATQTSFQFGKLIQKEANANLDLTYPVNVPGLASPVTVAAGGEYRRETYQQTAGDLQSYGAGPYAVPHPLYVQTAPGVYAPTGNFTAALGPGASGYGGTNPAAAGSWSVNSYGAYLDLETDITKNLSVTAAGRYEHYSTFGSATVGKVSALWKISDGLSLRGDVGTGYHAPSPGQSNDEILTTNFVAGNQVQTGTYPVASTVAQYYGAQTLKPEKSTNFGVGVVGKPTDHLTITADYYSIKVRDRLFVSQNFNVTAADVVAQPALAAVGVGGAVNYFTNAFDTLTQGVDVVATYRTGFAEGKLNLTLAYNYNSSTVSKFNPAMVSVAQIANIKNLAPHHRLNLQASWSKGPWAVNFREKYYSSWLDAVDYPTDAAGNGTTNQIFGAKVITDLDVSYTYQEHYTLTVGANNLFNTYPDRIASSPVNPVFQISQSLADGQIYPRSGGPFGINGGQWYVRLKVKY